MAEIIAAVVVVWLVFGFLGWLIIWDDITRDANHYAMVLFWPVTLPIFMVFALIFAIYSVFRSGFNLFRS